MIRRILPYFIVCAALATIIFNFAKPEEKTIEGYERFITQFYNLDGVASPSIDTTNRKEPQ